MRNPSLNEGERRNSDASSERWLRVRYAALTLLLCGPLLIAFVFVRNLYPFAASTMMMAGGDLQAGRTYYVMRGERATGETISLPPVELTNALSGRTWGLVAATAENKSFSIRSPHPANIALLETSGGIENLPPAARLPELLQAWGAIYNARLPPSSPQRLKAVTLEAYRWEPGSYSNYERFIQSWRIEL
jgi:uncharacterized membrane protein